MKILATKIEDDHTNYTRFLVLSKDKSSSITLNNNNNNNLNIKKDLLKNSVMFSLINAPGALFKALSVFAFRSIDLTKLESRPRRKMNLLNSDRLSKGAVKNDLLQHNITTNNDDIQHRFEYVFYIEFICSEIQAKACLDNLSEICPTIHVFGQYPYVNNTTK